MRFTWLAIVLFGLSSLLQADDELQLPSTKTSGADAAKGGFVGGRGKMARPSPAEVDAEREAFKEIESNISGGKLDLARDGLMKMIASGPKAIPAGYCRYRLAIVYKELHKEEDYFKQLELAAPEPSEATDRGTKDASNVCQEAIRELGRYHLRKGDYAKAKQFYTRWSPSSWCGTCMMEMASGRAQALMICRLHLGEQPGVAEKLLEGLHLEAISDSTNKAHFLPEDQPSEFRLFRALLREGNASEQNMILVRLYREASQTADLKKMLTEEGKEELTEDFKYLFRVDEMVENRNSKGLIDLLQHPRVGERLLDRPSERNWKSRYAADALIRCLGKDPTPVVETVKSLKELPPIQDDLFGDGVPTIRPPPTMKRLPDWAIYVLGRIDSPLALELLDSDVRRDVSGHSIVAIIQAISRHGESGKRVLSRLAKDTTNHIGYWAKKQLDEGPPDDSLERPWPLPKRGSLPTSLEDLKARQREAVKQAEKVHGK